MNDRVPTSPRGRTPMLMAAMVAVIVPCVLAAHAVADDPAPSPEAAAIPISAAKAIRGNVPVLMTGIGTVQALNSVLVRARVDGTLDSVAFIEGQDVRKGDLLAVIDPRPYQAILDQALAKKASDQAQLANAKLDQDRYASLVRSDFASRQQLDTQNSMVRQTTATIQGDDATIEAAALNVSFTHITAPFDGRVGLRLVDPGNLVHASDATGLVSLTQIKPIALVFTLPEKDLGQISDAMAHGKLTTFAYSSDNNARLAEGTLLTPDNAIDASTGTIKLKAIFPNTDGKLWPGQFVDARLQVAIRQDAVSIPSVAVQRGQERLFVFVVKPDHTAHVQTVEEAFEQDGRALITKGLNGDELVVTNGQSRLNDGSRISIAANGNSGS